MVTLQGFFRNTPQAQLKAYFETINIRLPDCITSKTSLADATAELERLVRGLPEEQQAQIQADADRIGVLADEEGQAAIFSVCARHDVLDGLENGFGRSAWAFVNEPQTFEQAEHIRYADHLRHSRSWDAFEGPARRRLKRDAQTIRAFKDKICAAFGASCVELDFCERVRDTLGGHAELVQTTIFHEGRSESLLSFLGGRLDRRAVRPVIEAAICYEPATGTIEVVSAHREARADLARQFAEHLLGSDIGGQPIRLRRYELQHLREPCDFPTEAQDQIEFVRLVLLRLMPLESQAERITLECSRGAGCTIWDMAEQRFGDRNPLRTGYLVTRARLVVRFKSAPGGRGPRSLPVTITLPHRCDLKDRTHREQLIGQKYLYRWRLLENE